jgi:lipopolysaccharide transport system ATP-binding protein
LISLENVSKKFCRNLRNSLLFGVEDIMKDLMLIKKRNNVLRSNEFWALENIFLEVKKGESVGIIGTNGSGKTTLLKLINGLIKPNTGKIEINGTIGALIALGTGFNPILTGKENVRIAASVLGMNNDEINDKMDEIITFSGIDEFIDAPVRTYSSGMLVRLGFAVATQLKPDILLVDEILAVGDLGFAIKCQKRIHDYRKNGGTLFIVSHAMHNIRFHCSKVLWLEKSKIMDYGDVNNVCDQYEKYIQKQSNFSRGKLLESEINVINVTFNDKIINNEGLKFCFEFESKIESDNPVILFAINDVKGEGIVSRYSHLDDFFTSINIGYNKLVLEFSKLPIKQGIYSITLVIGDGDINNQIFHAQNYYLFEVVKNNPEYGIIDIKPNWYLSNKL